MLSRTVIFLLCLSLVLSCQTEENKNVDSKVDSITNLKPTSDTAIVPIKLTKVEKKTILSECNNNKSREVNEEDDFVQSNIGYFIIDSIPKLDSLGSERFFMSLVVDSKSILIEPSNFLKNNYSFTQRSEYIHDYGDCIVGEFIFPKASNSAQHKLYVLINLKSKEVTVWNFESLIVVSNTIDCKFNVRGKLIDYKIRYSKKCDRFIYVP